MSNRKLLRLQPANVASVAIVIEVAASVNVSVGAATAAAQKQKKKSARSPASGFAVGFSASAPAEQYLEEARNLNIQAEINSKSGSNLCNIASATCCLCACCQPFTVYSQLYPARQLYPMIVHCVWYLKLEMKWKMNLQRGNLINIYHFILI